MHRDSDKQCIVTCPDCGCEYGANLASPCACPLFDPRSVAAVATIGVTSDERLGQCIEAAEQLRELDFDIRPPVGPDDDVGRLGASLLSLAQALEKRYREMESLAGLTARINAGLLLDEVLEIVYADFRDFIPYDRIGLALLEQDATVLRARWAKSEYGELKLGQGFAAPLAGSSLEIVIRSGRPRILNDLVQYLENKPESVSTRLVVEEGICSSLTCPLTANGVPVGFLFFSSTRPNTYASIHVETFERLAEQLSVIVEKARLVSEIATRQAEVEQKNEQLVHLNELKNRFLGMAAHDLRNPISSIRMVADVLESTDASLSEAEKSSFIRDISTQADEMLTLLHDLLDVSRIESGSLELCIETVDGASFVGEAVRRHNLLASPKGTRVQLESDEDISAPADVSRLRQVLDNLVSNAVKYSPPASIVRVESRATRGAWRISVFDEGPGVSEQDQSRLFQDFTRLSARPTGGESSTGLGLAIARRIVEAHGGTIGFRVNVPRGSEFWFELPLREATDKARAPHAESPDASIAAVESATSRAKTDEAGAP